MIWVLSNFYLISKYPKCLKFSPSSPSSLPHLFFYRIHWELWKVLITLNLNLTFLKRNQIWLLPVFSCIKTYKWAHVSQSTSHSSSSPTHSSTTLICYQSCQWACCNRSFPMVACMTIVLSCPKGKHVRSSIWFYCLTFSFTSVHHIFYHIFLF